MGSWERCYLEFVSWSRLRFTARWERVLVKQSLGTESLSTLRVWWSSCGHSVKVDDGEGGRCELILGRAAWMEIPCELQKPAKLISWSITIRNKAVINHAGTSLFYVLDLSFWNCNCLLSQKPRCLSRSDGKHFILSDELNRGHWWVTTISSSTPWLDHLGIIRMMRIIPLGNRYN